MGTTRTGEARVSLLAFLALLVFPACLQAQAPTLTPTTSPAPADAFIVPAGTVVPLTLLDPLHTRSTRAGDRAQFRVHEDVWVGSEVVIPRGSTVRATVVQVKRPGRIKGRAEIRLQFDALILADGTALPLNAALLRAGFHEIRRGADEGKVRSEGSAGRDAAAVAYGGVQGAILGGVVGGKKGVAYGSAVGAAVGLLGVLFERGPELDLPAGMRMDVELTQQLALPQAAVQLARTLPPPAAATPDLHVDTELEPESEEPEAAPAAESKTEPSGEAAPASRTPVPPPPVTEDPTSGDPNAYRMRVDVHLVLVETVVRGPQGQLLDNLTQEDFLVFEDRVAQTIRHFSRDLLPLAVALVVDTSGSVAPYMDELRRAALDALAQLKREDQVALFVFSDVVERLVELTSDRGRIAQRIQRLHGAGYTNILDALFEATHYLQLAAPERRRAIILVSDNQQTVRSQSNQSQVIRGALEADTVIYSIKTPGERTPLTLRLPTWLGGFGSVQKITRETGGEVIDVDQVGSVSAALRAVIARLKTRYTLGYHPTNKARDGSFRTIEVRLRERYGQPGHDYRIFAKTGYYAPRDSQPQQADAQPKPASP